MVVCRLLAQLSQNRAPLLKALRPSCVETSRGIELAVCLGTWNSGTLAQQSHNDPQPWQEAELGVAALQCPLLPVPSSSDTGGLYCTSVYTSRAPWNTYWQDLDIEQLPRADLL